VRMRYPPFLGGEHWSSVQRYFSQVFVAFRCPAVRSVVIHLFDLLLLLLFYNSSSVIRGKVFPVKLASNQNKHNVLWSASNAARDFPGRIRHRYLTFVYSVLY
jgi:hypothetical protein